MIRSTQMMLDPTTQAIYWSDRHDYGSIGRSVPIPLTQVMIHPLVSLSSGIFAKSARPQRTELNEVKNGKLVTGSSRKKKKKTDNSIW